MTHAMYRLLAAVPILLLAIAGDIRADGPVPATTTLTVADLDCPVCAKKLAAKLVAVPGVEKAEPNVEAKTVKVTHKAGEKLSPKALWEVSAKAGFEPSKLVGPDGTFTTKPTK